MKQLSQEMILTSIIIIVILSLLLFLIILMFYWLVSASETNKKKEYFNKIQHLMGKVLNSKLLIFLIFFISILLIIYSFYTLYTNFKNQSNETIQIIIFYVGFFIIIWYCFWAHHIKTKIIPKSQIVKANYLTLFSILTVSLLLFIISYLTCNVDILANKYQLSVVCIAILDLIIILVLICVVNYYYKGDWRLFLNIKKYDENAERVPLL
jgi:hypothetical protein